MPPDGSSAAPIASGVERTCAMCRTPTSDGRHILEGRVWACRACASELGQWLGEIVQRLQPRVVQVEHQCARCAAKTDPNFYMLLAAAYSAQAHGVTLRFEPPDTLDQELRKAVDVARGIDRWIEVADEDLVSNMDAAHLLEVVERARRLLRLKRVREHIREQERLASNVECDERELWREIRAAQRVLEGDRRKTAPRLPACAVPRVTLGPCWGFCEDGPRDGAKRSERRRGAGR